MKVFSITKKNLKLLMRSKTSMFVVLFGPLIIMLLVGFAFNNPSTSKINVGYYVKDKTNLTVSFLDAMKDTQKFKLEEFKDPDTCVNNIEQSIVHICIIFPDNFVIDNNKTNEIVFYVDQSRTNFIYVIIEAVSSKISLQSSQLSYKMTSDLLSVIANTQKTNADSIARIAQQKKNIDDLTTQLAKIQDKLKALDLNQVSVNTGNMIDWTGNIQTDVLALKNKGKDVVTSGKTFVAAISDYVSDANATETLVTPYGASLDASTILINNASNKTVTDINTLVEVIDSISVDITTLNKKLDTAKNTSTDVTAQISNLKTQIASLKSDMDALKNSTDKINSQINSLSVTSAESIVNPITTRIEPISKKSSNLNFIFPYLIILIIAFISIMLSSTLIIMEKTSKAYFRNFTTPTKDITFIISVFLTSFVVVVLQLIFIMIIAYYFLNASITSNIGLSILLVLVAITLFTLLGMIIGYLFNSQEAVTMASISLGSVFLFLSNLILPLESMSATLQQAARYNPYVMASELLKQLTLFGSVWKDVKMDFLMLAVYLVGAFLLVVIVEKFSKIKYISKKPMSKQIVKKDEIIDKYFKLKSGILIRNEKELLMELKKMSDSTFQIYVTSRKNDFETWLLLNSNNILAKRIGPSRNRKEMIDIIEAYQKEITDPTKKE